MCVRYVQEHKKCMLLIVYDVYMLGESESHFTVYTKWIVTEKRRNFEITFVHFKLVVCLSPWIFSKTAITRGYPYHNLHRKSSDNWWSVFFLKNDLCTCGYFYIFCTIVYKYTHPTVELGNCFNANICLYTYLQKIFYYSL